MSKKLTNQVVGYKAEHNTQEKRCQVKSISSPEGGLNLLLFVPQPQVLIIPVLDEVWQSLGSLEVHHSKAPIGPHSHKLGQIYNDQCLWMSLRPILLTCVGWVQHLPEHAPYDYAVARVEKVQCFHSVGWPVLGLLCDKQIGRQRGSEHEFDERNGTLQCFVELEKSVVAFKVWLACHVLLE